MATAAPASAASSAASSAAGTANVIGSAVDAAATIANTIAGINDLNQRRKFEFNLSMMNHDEQLALAKKLQASGDYNTRLQILVNTMLTMRIEGAKSTQSKETTKIIIIASTSIVLLGLMVWYFKQ